MRKITKYRAYSTLLAAAISLTGCSSQVQKFENNQKKEVYCSEKPLEEEKVYCSEKPLEEEQKVDTTEKDANKENLEVNIEGDYFFQNSYIVVVYEEDFDSITIIGRKKNLHQSDEFYHQLNRIIQEKNITELNFWKLNDTFDFSKIDSSNITNLEFDACSGKIDLKENDLLKLEEIHFSNCSGMIDLKENDLLKLEEVYFSNFIGAVKGIDVTKKYHILQFFNTPLRIVKPYILKSDTRETQIYWVEDGKKKRHLKSFLECLVENHISMEQLDIYEGNSQDYNGMSTEEFDLLSKLKVKYINIEDGGFKKPLHLDLTLNEMIQDFHLETYYRPAGKDIIHGELGNIKIRTNNKKLYCGFSYTDITKNTHFSLPNCTRLDLDNLECRDISVFDDLSNITYLWFKEDLGPELEADHNGAITYCRDCSHISADVYTNQIVEPFREYNEFLNYLKMCNQLEKVQKNLNISAKEDDKYEDIISIGDIVNLKEENAPIYKASDSNKSTTSYYGTSELRCIRSISLAKGEHKITVDNMKDYETFIKLGFGVEKYNLVNQYSLNADGSLTSECYCDKGGVQLVYTPFNRKK